MDDSNLYYKRSCRSSCSSGRNPLVLKVLVPAQLDAHTNTARASRSKKGTGFPYIFGLAV